MILYWGYGTIVGWLIVLRVKEVFGSLMYIFSLVYYSGFIGEIYEKG